MATINSFPYILNTIASAGADVSLSNGLLRVTGVPAIPVRNIQEAALKVSWAGVGVVYTITSTAAIAASTTYSGSFRQVVAGKVYELVFTFTTDAVAPSATAFYAQIQQIIQNGIDAGQVLGSVTSSSGGTVFTSSVLASRVNFALGGLSVAAAATTLTVAGSSATNATPRVFTAGAAHNLVVGGLYEITFVGVTGTGAADLNRTLVGIVTGASTIALLNTSNTGTVDTTAASSITVTQISKDDLQDDLGANTGYATTKSFIGYALDFKTNGEIESGPVVSYDVMLNVTDNSVANVNSAFVALIGALNGSNAAEMVAVV